MKTPNFEYKEDIATTRILNLNTKTIENKHFIHYLKRFPQTLSLCFCFCNANISMQVSVFSFSCPKFQCLYIFKNLRVDCFRCKLSSVWPHIFLLNGPDKKPKQNSSKTKRHSQQQEAKSVRRDEPPSANKTVFWRVVAGTSR